MKYIRRFSNHLKITWDNYLTMIRITDPTPAPPLEGRGMPTDSLQEWREPTPLPSRGGAGVGSVISNL
ncbi:MAG: hypothetical protein IKZ48_00420, partial [Prevotella sp.]|nr:hypothetical protein [Prevotella sp.]